MHIVYRTENKVNGKFYYGAHNNTKPNYLGSGKMLLHAINKYGRNNFIRRTIKEFETEQEALEFEELIVDAVMKNPDCYNITKGGGKPPVFRGHTEESKLKIKKNHARPMLGKRWSKKPPREYPKGCYKMTQEHKDKIGAGNKRTYSISNQCEFLGVGRRLARRLLTKREHGRQDTQL